MTDYSFTTDDLDALRVWDTPTICNGLEIVGARAPRHRLHRRAYGVRRSETVSNRWSRPNRHDPRYRAAARTHSAPRRLVRMSLIILFSYSSHLVRTMTCGGASCIWETLLLQITAALERRGATRQRCCRSSFANARRT